MTGLLYYRYYHYFILGLGLCSQFLDASAFVAPFHAFLIVSPMEHKRDATVAGLAWPSNPNRGLAPTNPDQAPDAQASALCHSGLPDPTTGTTSAPLAADNTTTDIGTTAHSDTYSGFAPPDVPFPTSQVLHTTTFIVPTSLPAWFTRSNSRSLPTPTIPGSYSLKRSPCQGSPDVVTPSTTFTVFRATGSGHCAQRIIGDIILRFL